VGRGRRNGGDERGRMAAEVVERALQTLGAGGRKAPRPFFVFLLPAAAVPAAHSRSKILEKQAKKQAILLHLSKPSKTSKKIVKKLSFPLLK